MTKDAPAFDFYPERWTHGTRLFSKVERSDYIDLLCHQWTDDGLPADLDMLARLLGYKRGAQVPAIVVEKFPISGDGKRRNERLEIERTKQRNRIAKKAQGASITNAKRWGKRSDSVSLSDQIATVERVASESPPPTTHHSPHTSVDKSPDVEGRTPRRAAPAPADDETWLAELEKAPAYQGINIRCELGKMQQWCQVNGKQPSRRRFVNWLNNARPMQVNGHRPQPKHPAYNAQTHTAGMSGDDIGLFDPHQK